MLKNSLFSEVFGSVWQTLPPVMHKHYANRPYSTDKVVAKGTMDISRSWLAHILAPLFWLAKTLVPYNGKQVPVTVYYRSDPSSPSIYFDRHFFFPGKSPYRFSSRMEHIKDAQLVEWMHLGIGWSLEYQWDGSKVILAHRGYVWRCCGKLISLPLDWLIGVGYAEEEAISADQFRMEMHLTHPLFGKIFSYKGIFTIDN
jgi:hypothetical protein